MISTLLITLVVIIIIIAILFKFGIWIATILFKILEWVFELGIALILFPLKLVGRIFGIC